MKNCIDCKHKRTAFSDISSVQGLEQIDGRWFGICAEGHTNDLIKFLSENGKRNRLEVNEELPCFEASDFDKGIDRILELSNKLLGQVKSSAEKNASKYTIACFATGGPFGAGAYEVHDEDGKYRGCCSVMALKEKGLVHRIDQSKKAEAFLNTDEGRNWFKENRTI